MSDVRRLTLAQAEYTWPENCTVVKASDYDLLKAESNALKEQNNQLWETYFNLAEKLGIDTLAERSAPGKPSDVFLRYIEELRSRVVVVPERDKAVFKETLHLVKAEVDREQAYREFLQSANAGLAEKVERLGDERDALAAQLAELKGQEPVACVIEEPYSDCGSDGHHWHISERLPCGMKLYAQPVAPAHQAVQELYECIGKGGEYEKLGYAKPSGAERTIRGESGLIVYRDTRNGQLYYRDPHDFQQRMQKIAAAPQPVAQEGE